ncbi:hypothetical protein [Pseudorhizobium halotolerans]|uniref:hypothetical protein n=1 Tax=Pseudorhizobium halotolerans TaxID=1233081 RepID=UPI001157DC5B|nr:hypothetical protein [Pseudorhizobium halotolerans]
MISQTDQGCFTLAQRPTRPSWPSPMLFYVAESPAPTQLGKAGYWERSVSITGRWYEAGMLSADLEK